MISDKEFDAGVTLGTATQPRAVSARYNARTKRIDIEFNNNAAMSYPPELNPLIAESSARDLSEIEITIQGLGLYFPRLELDVSIERMVSDVFGALTARGLAKAGGQARSRRKAAAARLNGAKGGRPAKRKKA